MAIAGAVEALGIAGWTVRCHIKSGKVKADLVPGYYGVEYPISELSHVLTVVAGVDEALPCALNKAPDMVKAVQCAIGEDRALCPGRLPSGSILPPGGAGEAAVGKTPWWRSWLRRG